MEKNSVPLSSRQPSWISMFAEVPMRCKSPEMVRDPLTTTVGVLSMVVELAIATSPPAEVQTPRTHVKSNDGGVPVQVASVRGGEATSRGGEGGGMNSRYHHSSELAMV